MKINKLTLLRYIGNLLIFIGYYFLLFIDIKIGLLIKIIGPLLLIPSFAILKLWDVLFLTAIFYVMDISKFIQLIMNK